MINLLLLALGAVIIAGLAFALWRFVKEAEQPQAVMEKPSDRDPALRHILARVEAWRKEGKISREEYEHIRALCYEGDKTAS